MLGNFFFFYQQCFLFNLPEFQVLLLLKDGFFQGRKDNGILKKIAYLITQLFVQRPELSVNSWKPYWKPPTVHQPLMPPLCSLSPAHQRCPRTPQQGQPPCDPSTLPTLSHSEVWTSVPQLIEALDKFYRPQATLFMTPAMSGMWTLVVCFSIQYQGLSPSS